MKVAFYIGDHSGEVWYAQVGLQVTRLVQKGPYSHVTHVEAIHAEHSDGSVTIASSSLRDKGVRAKRVHLNPAHWIIVDVPSWDVNLSIALLVETEGLPYDLRGAIATAFLGAQDSERYFCNEWVATPFLVAPGTFGPHHLCAIALSLGTEESQAFFARMGELARQYALAKSAKQATQLALL